MFLSDAAAIAEILGLIFVVGGGAIALAQWRTSIKDKRDGAAIKFLMEMIQSAEFFTAIRKIRKTSAEELADLDNLDEEVRQAIDLFYIKTEPLGLIVHDGHMDIEVLHRMAGNGIANMYEHLRPHIEAVREQEEGPDAFEWVEWLAKELGAQPKSILRFEASGVHVTNAEGHHLRQLSGDNLESAIRHELPLMDSVTLADDLSPGDRSRWSAFLRDNTGLAVNVA